MTGFIEAIHADREDLDRVLDKHRGIRTIVEELDPDNAQFLREVLQNTGDCNATKVIFELNSDLPLVLHNWAISGTGEGAKDTKRDEARTINQSSSGKCVSAVPRKGQWPGTRRPLTPCPLRGFGASAW